MKINWEDLDRSQAKLTVNDLVLDKINTSADVIDLLSSCVFMSSSVEMADKILLVRKMLEVVSRKEDIDLLAQVVFGLDKQKAFSLFTTVLIDNLIKTDDLFVLEKFTQDPRFEYFKGRGSLLFLGLFANDQEKRVFDILNRCQEKTVFMMIPSIVNTLGHNLFFSPEASEKTISWFAENPLFREAFFEEEKTHPFPSPTPLSSFLQSKRVVFEEKKMLQENLGIDNLKNPTAQQKKM